MPNTPKVRRDNQFEKPAKVKRTTARGIGDRKLPTRGRSPYDNPPSRARDPNGHRY
jgi:hypothetical protein